MEKIQLIHQKKVKLMGTILIVVSIFSAVTMLPLLGLSGYAYGKFGETINFQEVLGDLSSEETGEAKKHEMETSNLIRESKELLGGNYEGSEAEAAIEELKQADKELEEAERELNQMLGDIPSKPFNLRVFFYGMLIATILTVVASVFLFMVGRSWRATDPFSRRVIIGLRGLGITFLVQSMVVFFFPDTTGDDMSGFVHLLNAAPLITIGTAPLFSLGVVLLTLSWVIEHGQQLNESNKLTI